VRYVKVVRRAAPDTGRNLPARPPGALPAGRAFSRAAGDGERALPAILVAGAVFVDTLLYGLVVPIVPGYARSLGAGTGLLGVVFGAYAVGMLAVSPVAALLTERLGARRVLAVSGAGIVASALVWAESGNVGMLVAARALQGGAAGLTWTAGLAFTATSYGPGRRGQVMSWLLTAMAAGSVLGAPAGGVLADLLGYRAPFLLTAGLAAAEVPAFWRLLPRGSVRPARGNLVAGAGALLAHGSSRNTFLAVLGASTAVSTAEPFLPLRLRSELNLSPGAIGLLFGLTMTVFAVASPLAAALARRAGLARLMAAGLAGMAAVMPALALAPSVPAASCALAGLGICLALVLTPALTALGEVVDATGASHGMTYALFNIVYAGGMLLGPLEGGLVSQGFGLTAAFTVTGLLCLVPVAACGRGLLRRPGEPAEPARLSRARCRRSRRSAREPRRDLPSDHGGIPRPALATGP
jgi:MFS transporter, DHA1 family, solute carrier family 18 (vesicular amine transporter), member 1/2